MALAFGGKSIKPCKVFPPCSVAGSLELSERVEWEPLLNEERTTQKLLKRTLT